MRWTFLPFGCDVMSWVYCKKNFSALCCLESQHYSSERICWKWAGLRPPLVHRFSSLLIIKFSALVLLCAVRHLSCHHFRHVKTFAINNSRNNHHTQARSANTDQIFLGGKSILACYVHSMLFSRVIFLHVKYFMVIAFTCLYQRPKVQIIFTL